MGFNFGGLFVSALDFNNAEIGKTFFQASFCDSCQCTDAQMDLSGSSGFTPKHLI